MFVAGEDNAVNVGYYLEYLHAFARTIGARSQALEMRRPPRLWSNENISVLIKHRSKTNPTCFDTIATHLNDLEERRPSVTDPCMYTSRDCQNKWATLFPSRHDMYSTIHFLKKLEIEWPGTVCRMQNAEKDITSVHIVWPWTYDTMKNQSKTVFCDATFHVTIYKFKLVCLTTLDGNHHHRPLMLSFIKESTTEEWQQIFNLFFSVVRHHSPRELYAITSDQEKAIKSGLKKSQMRDTAVHFFCSLHATWSKCMGTCHIACLRHPSSHLRVIRHTLHPHRIHTQTYRRIKLTKHRPLAKKRVRCGKKMQMAEGPNAFRQGIEAMVEAYANDPSRKRYIRELSLQSSRHHFSRTIWLADIAPYINW